jgi:hypothetical protein
MSMPLEKASRWRSPAASAQLEKLAELPPLLCVRLTSGVELGV